MYLTGLKKEYATKKVVAALLSPHLASDEAVALVVKCGVCCADSAPHVRHVKNLLADDPGAWHPSGTRKQFY